MLPQKIPAAPTVSDLFIYPTLWVVILSYYLYKFQFKLILKHYVSETSTETPVPIVDETDNFLRYLPLLDAGLALTIASKTVFAFS